MIRRHCDITASYYSQAGHGISCAPNGWKMSAKCNFSSLCRDKTGRDGMGLVTLSWCVFVACCCCACDRIGVSEWANHTCISRHGLTSFASCMYSRGAVGAWQVSWDLFQRQDKMAGFGQMLWEACQRTMFGGEKGLKVGHFEQRRPGNKERRLNFD